MTAKRVMAPSFYPIYITIDGRGLRNSESEEENTKTTSFSVSASIRSVFFFHGLMHWRGHLTEAGDAFHGFLFHVGMGRGKQEKEAFA